MDSRVFNRYSVDSNDIVYKDSCFATIDFACGKSVCPIGVKVGKLIFLAWSGVLSKSISVFNLLISYRNLERSK